MTNGTEATRGIAAFLEPPRTETPKAAGTMAERAHKEAGDLLAVMQDIPKERRPLALETVRRWMELDEPTVEKTAWADLRKQEMKAPARRGWRIWRRNRIAI